MTVPCAVVFWWLDESCEDLDWGSGGPHFGLGTMDPMSFGRDVARTHGPGGE